MYRKDMKRNVLHSACGVTLRKPQQLEQEHRVSRDLRSDPRKNSVAKHEFVSICIAHLEV